ncbi:MAG: hypothetical protein PVJ21_08165 [Anaerolineales bacterium]|jgi:hypothetical protein
MKVLVIIIIVFAGLFLLSWLELQVKPKPFQPYPEQQPELDFIPLPDGLPAPVERFYKAVYGNKIPVIETAVIKGQAVLSPFGFKLPSRFIFVHNAGKDYRHYIESTWFGLPVMRVNESYVDGKSYFELPIGTFENDPSITQAAGLGLWAEAVWFPSIWLNDQRARWEPVDEKTALLYIPFGEGEENFVVRFDPETGLLDTLEAMRYRDAGPNAKKILWITKTLPGEYIEGTKLSTVGSATWFDQGKPWAVFTLKEVKYNVDVNAYIRQRGP